MKYFKIAIAGILTLFGLFVINDYIVSEAELQEFKTDFEIETVQTFQQFQGQMDQRFDLSRYSEVTEQLARERYRLEQDSNNQAIRNEVNRLERKQSELRNKLGL